MRLDTPCAPFDRQRGRRILTLRAPAEAISVLGGPMAKYFGCQKDMVFRVDCYQGCYVINPSGGKRSTPSSQGKRYSVESLGEFSRIRSIAKYIIFSCGDLLTYSN